MDASKTAWRPPELFARYIAMSALRRISSAGRDSAPSTTTPTLAPGYRVCPPTGLGTLLAGDVRLRAGQAQRAPALVSHGQPPALHPAHAVVCMGDAIEAVELLGPPPEGIFDSLAQARDVLGMDAVEPVLDAGADLAVAQAQHRLPARREVELARLEVPIPQAVVGGARRQRVALLAPPQRLLRLAPLVDLTRELGIGRRQLRGPALELEVRSVDLVQHAIEGLPKLRDLDRAAHGGSEVQPAGADDPCDLLQALDRRRDTTRQHHGEANAEKRERNRRREHRQHESARLSPEGLGREADTHVTQHTRRLGAAPRIGGRLGQHRGLHLQVAPPVTRPDERVDGLPDGPERRAFARGSPRPLPSGTLDERPAVPAGGHHVGDLGIHVAACRPPFARASRRRFRRCETIPAASRTSPKACLWGRA